MRQIYLLRKKKRIKKKQSQKLSLKERLAQQTIQKQLHILKLREYLVLVGFTLGAAALRAPMQVVPSAEPITFFAVLSGWLFGKKKGFLVGAGSLYASNFLVFGGQGIWTVFQALGFGIAGFLGGFLTKKSKVWNVVLITILGTILFELIVNIGSIFMFPWGIFSLFITALPFTMIHLVSNTLFAFLLPKTKKVVDEKGEFNQKEVCRDLLKKIEDIKNIKVMKK